MTRNVGLLDRIARFVIGVALLGLYGALDSPWRYATLIGLVLIATAVTAACPIYGLLGWSTLRRVTPPPSPPASPTDAGNDEGRHSDAWWAAHDPSEDEKTWPPREPPSWRPGNSE